ncbi:MBL fold metallo-hydrolase [Methanobacterium alcaliphilum]|uniref:MBL fold metallo-hydrolase n=1 Tax=Methanobacterium alcaliphilum TaxID=392018 RepID=UPI00200AF217|nr:MBL fold metallo-hydrolase [Methanobacterium alcaliphilum]MCK9150454.1 MBL fold metallo-hydrolase [Methanobacterium alcaliphilum]
MEVFPGIYQFKRGANFYLVDGDKMTLIDTGMPGSSAELFDFVEKTLKRDLNDIKTIILTHHDFDHVGDLAKIKKRTGAKIAIHKDDVDYVTGKKEDKSLPWFAKIFIKLAKYIYRPENVEVDILLDEDDQIGPYHVIHMPGHTPGSIGLYDKKNKVLFVGDNLGYMKNKIEGPPSLFTPDMMQAEKSLKKLRGLDVKAIFTGHSKGVTSKASLKLNDYLDNLA